MINRDGLKPSGLMIMSEKPFRYKLQSHRKTSPNLEIAIANRLLNLVLSRGWTDYDNFSSELAYNIAKTRPHSRNELTEVINSFQCPFFTLNNIKKKQFVEILPIDEILSLFGKYVEMSPITFSDVFSETNNVSIDEGKKLVSNLANVPETTIQGALLDSLREKNATNCRDRTKDTVLEVGDLEHFSLDVKGTPRTFAVVAKGYNSVKGKTITWEDIAHQVTKAYNRTNPDHILIVLAKNLTDSVVSELVQYGKSVGNENLAIIADPLTVVRFLRARNLVCAI